MYSAHPQLQPGNLVPKPGERVILQVMMLSKIYVYFSFLHQADAEGAPAIPGGALCTHCEVCPEVLQSINYFLSWSTFTCMFSEF